MPTTTSGHQCIASCLKQLLKHPVAAIINHIFHASRNDLLARKSTYRLITRQRPVSLKINKFRTKTSNEPAKKGGHAYRAPREI